MSLEGPRETDSHGGQGLLAPLLQESLLSYLLTFCVTRALKQITVLGFF